jgi:hypothetical protein
MLLQWFELEKQLAQLDGGGGVYWSKPVAGRAIALGIEEQDKWEGCRLKWFENVRVHLNHDRRQQEPKVAECGMEPPQHHNGSRLERLLCVFLQENKFNCGLLPRGEPNPVATIH